MREKTRLERKRPRRHRRRVVANLDVVIYNASVQLVLRQRFSGAPTISVAARKRNNNNNEKNDARYSRAHGVVDRRRGAFVVRAFVVVVVGGGCLGFQRAEERNRNERTKR